MKKFFEGLFGRREPPRPPRPAEPEITREERRQRLLRELAAGPNQWVKEITVQHPERLGGSMAVVGDCFGRHLGGSTATPYLNPNPRFEYDDRDELIMRQYYEQLKELRPLPPMLICQGKGLFWVLPQSARYVGRTEHILNLLATAAPPESPSELDIIFSSYVYTLLFAQDWAEKAGYEETKGIEFQLPLARCAEPGQNPQEFPDWLQSQGLPASALADLVRANRAGDINERQLLELSIPLGSQGISLNPYLRFGAGLILAARRATPGSRIGIVLDRDWKLSPLNTPVTKPLQDLGRHFDALCVIHEPSAPPMSSAAARIKNSVCPRTIY